MLYKKITFDSDRGLQTFERDIIDFYKDLVNSWNTYSNFIENEPTDGRTNEYKNYYHALDNFIDIFVHLYDKIIQTKNEYEGQLRARDKQIKELEAKLRVWTDQQKGRKPVLTEAKKAQVLEWSQAGISGRKIAKRLGVSATTIWNFLKEHKKSQA